MTTFNYNLLASVKVHIGQGLKYNLQYSRNRYHHHFRARAE